MYRTPGGLSSSSSSLPPPPPDSLNTLPTEMQNLVVHHIASSGAQNHPLGYLHLSVVNKRLHALTAQNILNHYAHCLRANLYRLMPQANEVQINTFFEPMYQPHLNTLNNQRDLNNPDTLNAAAHKTVVNALYALELSLRGDIVLGAYHTCLWHEEAGLRVCGINERGQLGPRQVSTDPRSTFQRVVYPATDQSPWGNARILQVGAGRAHTRVHTTMGQLLYGQNGPLWMPQGNLLAISPLGLFGYGNNDVGQLGLGHNNAVYAYEHIFDPATGLPPWGNAPLLRVYSGSYHNFVLTTAGLFASGLNSWGQLGRAHQSSVQRPYIEWTFQPVPLGSVFHVWNEKILGGVTQH